MSFPPAPPSAPKRSGVSKVLLLMIAVAVLGVGAGGYGFGRLMLGYHAYTQVSGNMSPTLVRGDRLVVRQVDGVEVHRGDLVAIDMSAYADSPRDGISVVRVVGVAGDTVACCTDEHLTVDGKPITEPYITPGYEGLFEFSAKVPEGAIFVEGDNRGNSDDSRFGGHRHGRHPEAVDAGHLVHRRGPARNAVLRRDLDRVAVVDPRRVRAVRGRHHRSDRDRRPERRKTTKSSRSPTNALITSRL
jgi:signal peptidase I